MSGLGFLVGQSLPLAYFIIYAATIFLGNIAAFISFWVVSRGYSGSWGIPLLALAIFCAEATGDLLWYSLGRGLRNTRFGNWIKNHLPGHQKIESILQRNGKKLLFFSKFAYGASFPIIFLVGWTRMEFARFFRNSILSILAWLPIFFGLAYVLISGLAPLQAVATFKDVEFAFFVALALFLFLHYLIAKAIAILIERKTGAGV